MRDVIWNICGMIDVINVTCVCSVLWSAAGAGDACASTPAGDACASARRACSTWQIMGGTVST